MVRQFAEWQSNGLQTAKGLPSADNELENVWLGMPTAWDFDVENLAQ